MAAAWVIRLAEDLPQMRLLIKARFIRSYKEIKVTYIKY
jgi:hypothetical protein